MKIYNIFNNNEQEFLKGKADFILALSVTKTCEIEGITQAGIEGQIPLTPTLDSEFLINEKIFSLPNVAKTPSGVPTPALITKAIDNLYSFAKIEILDLGLDITPQNIELKRFDISPSNSIDIGANIDAKSIFSKGIEYAKSYQKRGDYIILAESTPSGTTTANASALALGYDVVDDFSSSFLDAPKSLKKEVVSKALSLIKDDMSSLDKLSIVSDNMLIFYAGFVIEASKKHRLVLAGGTQMASLLLIVDKLADELDMEFNSDNLTLATTQWVAKDKKSNISHILSQLSYKLNAIYTSFSFENANIPILKKYDEGEAKEGVGAGASLAYGFTHCISQQNIVDEIENIMKRL